VDIKVDTKEILTGSHMGYDWLTSTEDYTGTLLKLCPEVFINRHLAVTCIDGGAGWLLRHQLPAAWEARGGIAYSPKLDRVEDIPHQLDGPDGPGYDELYTFEQGCDLGERLQGNIFLEQFAPAAGRTAVFVTWAGFILHDANPNVFSDLFWPQLHRLHPESYIADGGECLTFVCRNRDLFDLVHDRLKSA
jgi:hypothetical protein